MNPVKPVHMTRIVQATKFVCFIVGYLIIDICVPQLKDSVNNITQNVQEPTILSSKLKL